MSETTKYFAKCSYIDNELQYQSIVRVQYWSGSWSDLMSYFEQYFTFEIGKNMMYLITFVVTTDLATAIPDEKERIEYASYNNLQITEGEKSLGGN